MGEGQHIQVLFLSDMIEENGKTVKENNITIKHKIPIGTLVEVDCDYLSSHKVRLYVKEHTRDCDGSPLYSIGFKGDSEPWIISGGYMESQENLVRLRRG